MSTSTNYLQLIKAGDNIVNTTDYNSNLQKIDNNYKLQLQSLNDLREQMLESRYLFWDEDYAYLWYNSEDQQYYRANLVGTETTPSTQITILDSATLQTLQDGIAWIMLNKGESTNIGNISVPTPPDKGTVVQKASMYGNDGSREIKFNYYNQSFGGYYKIKEITSAGIVWEYCPATLESPESQIKQSLLTDRLWLYEISCTFNLSGGNINGNPVLSTTADGYTITAQRISATEGKVTVSISDTTYTGEIILNPEMLLWDGTIYINVPYTINQSTVTAGSESLSFKTDSFYLNGFTKMVLRFRLINSSTK